MDKTRNVAAICATVISVIALFLVALGGGTLLALESLLNVATMGRAGGTLLQAYPLGAGVLLVYAVGIALGIAALRWAMPAALAMLPLGACALVFGGPVAKVYGILMILCAIVLLVPMHLRRHVH